MAASKRSKKKSDSPIENELNGNTNSKKSKPSESEKKQTPSENEKPKFTIEASGHLKENFDVAKQALEATETGTKMLIESNAFEKFITGFKKWSPSVKKFQLKKLEEKVTSFFTICTKLLGVITATALIIASMNGLLDESYILDPIKVPEGFIKDGADGAEISSRIMKEIRDTQKEASRSEDILNSKSGEQKMSTKLDFDFNKNIAKEDVIILGVSLNSVKQILRTAFGIQNKTISGSIIKRTKELEMSIRISSNKESILVRYPIEDGDVYSAMDGLLQKSALELLKITDPVLVAWYFVAKDENSKNNYEESLDYIKSLIDSDHPDTNEMYMIWGIILKYQKNYKEAIDKFQKSEELGLTDNMNLYYGWTLSLYLLKDYKGSYEKASKITSLNSKDVNGYILLGISASKLGREQEAIAYYKKAIEIDPNLVSAYLSLGNVYSDLNKKDEVIAYYKKAIEIDPNFVQAYNNLGLVFLNQKNYEKAIASFEKAIGVDPNFVQPYNNLGTVYHEQDKKEEAIKYYKKSIEIDPNFIQAYDNLGTVYRELNKKDIAIKYYKKIIEIDPKHANAYYNIGDIFYSKKNKEEAIKYYKKVIEIDPNFTNAYYSLGSILYSQNKKDEAIKYYKRSIEIDSKNVYAYYNLGIVYSEKNKKEEAISYYKQAIEIDPNYANAYFSLGEILQSQGKKEEAITNYKKTIDLSPELDSAYGNLSQIYFTMRDLENGKKYLDLAFDKNKKEDKLTIELWFYTYAHIPEKRKEAKDKIKELLEKGIRSYDWNYNENVKIATEDGHTEPKTLKNLAKKIKERKEDTSSL